jgi:hypothetical protein
MAQRCQNLAPEMKSMPSAMTPMIAEVEKFGSMRIRPQIIPIMASCRAKTRHVLRSAPVCSHLRARKRTRAIRAKSET